MHGSWPHTQRNEVDIDYAKRNNGQHHDERSCADKLPSHSWQFVFLLGCDLTQSRYRNWSLWLIRCEFLNFFGFNLKIRFFLNVPSSRTHPQQLWWELIWASLLSAIITDKRGTSSLAERIYDWSNTARHCLTARQLHVISLLPTCRLPLRGNEAVDMPTYTTNILLTLQVTSRSLLAIVMLILKTSQASPRS